MYYYKYKFSAYLYKKYPTHVTVDVIHVTAILEKKRGFSAWAKYWIRVGQCPRFKFNINVFMGMKGRGGGYSFLLQNMADLTFFLSKKFANWDPFL